MKKVSFRLGIFFLVDKVACPQNRLLFVIFGNCRIPSSFHTYPQIAEHLPTPNSQAHKFHR